MSKKKRYEYSDNFDNDEFVERREKKKALRAQHKEKWRFNPRESYSEESEEYEEPSYKVR